jgi:hypothetical protein
VISAPTAPPDHPQIAQRPALCFHSSLRSIADGAPWGRFGEIFAYHEDKEVLTFE